MRLCSIDGCDRKHRARGLCSSHYNERHQPDRHRKVTVPCDYCGKPCEKAPTSQYRRRYCSTLCRDLHRLELTDGDPMKAAREARKPRPAAISTRTKCYLPPAHPVWVLVRQYEQARLLAVRELMQPRACEECGEQYHPGTTVQRYCTRRCARRVGKRARRAREHGAPGTFTWTELTRIFLRFDRCCAYCQRPIEGQPDPDHVVPLSRGGSNSLSNILPACRLCNCDKNDMTLDEWATDRLRRGLPPVIDRIPAGDPRYFHLALGSPTRPRPTQAWQLQAA